MPGQKQHKKNRMTINQPVCRWLSSPAQTATVLTSTTLMRATFQSLSGWEKTKPSDGCTAKPAELASANGRAHLCNIASCRRPLLYALSNVSATAALLRRQQTPVRLIPAPCSGYSKEQENVPPISIACSLNSSTGQSRPTLKGRVERLLGTSPYYRFPNVTQQGTANLQHCRSSTAAPTHT